MKYIILIMLINLSVSSFSQEISQQGNIINTQLTVKVGEPINEHDIFLLKKELKSQTESLEYVSINNRDRLVTIKALKNDISLYTIILDQYFNSYVIKSQGEIVYKRKQKTAK